MWHTCLGSTAMWSLSHTKEQTSIRCTPCQRGRKAAYGFSHQLGDWTRLSAAVAHAISSCLRQRHEAVPCLKRTECSLLLAFASIGHKRQQEKPRTPPIKCGFHWRSANVTNDFSCYLYSTQHESAPFIFLLFFRVSSCDPMAEKEWSEGQIEMMINEYK